MRGRFAAIRVRPAHRDAERGILRPVEWLLVEWPKGGAEPTKYSLSTLPERTPLRRLAYLAKLRWRIERDFEDLKQEVGLGHYEGRGWRGFHHHATLAIAAYGFLVAERAAAIPPRRGAGGRRPRVFRPASPRAAARLRPERHDPASISSRRVAIAAGLISLLPRCPCCLQPRSGENSGGLDFMTQ